MSNNYDTDNFNTAELALQVVAIHICGYRNPSNTGDEDGNPPTNHWAAFMQLPTGGSVRLDMAPGYGSDGRRGKIELSSKKYTYTQNAIKTLSFGAIAYVTVQMVTEMINRNGRDKYNFTEEWEGCRFWIYTFISDLEAAGIIPAGSAQATWAAVSYYWRSPSGQELRDVKQGEFR
ncbi:hypothetical protein P152DRAFT_461279 [Eremomyces bilateralis CBS 781.70]|uniref:DUF7770 domain-containing protein n=1 Tax=Eremomyces bilateralis CBS 781.70 TaxID=1392243 RepID=A0A6G1FUY1_9PEZI|nr:uncharacterized protein P152DRAFT_461279 [Eremomyces bilateralis CBS 781.70]KAF1809594.1 hypothetical protein P152DRAFT_461279 [Eremomyces bilateralis CBS 781.70]